MRDGDPIEIDIPNRSIHLAVSDREIAERRAHEEARGHEAYTPKDRDRAVSKALQAYAALVTSADTGAVRDLEQLKK
mgnify:CR=1 FL=1